MNSEAPEPSGDPRHPGPLARFLKWLKHEVTSMATVAVFFFLSFVLLRLTRSAVLGKFNLHDIDPLRALVGGLLVAKGVVVADAVKFVARNDDRPIAWAAAWKTGIYALLALAFEYAGALVEFRHSGWAAASRRFADEFWTPVFWMLHVWLVVLLFGFTAAREFIRHVGPARFREWFFGPSPKGSRAKSDRPLGRPNPSGL